MKGKEERETFSVGQWIIAKQAHLDRLDMWMNENDFYQELITPTKIIGTGRTTKLANGSIVQRLHLDGGLRQSFVLKNYRLATPHEIKKHRMENMF